MPFRLQEASAAAARDAQAKQVAATEAHKQMEALVLGMCWGRKKQRRRLDVQMLSVKKWETHIESNGMSLASRELM